MRLREGVPVIVVSGSSRSSRNSLTRKSQDLAIVVSGSSRSSRNCAIGGLIRWVNCSFWQFAVKPQQPNRRRLCRRNCSFWQFAVKPQRYIFDSSPYWIVVSGSSRSSRNYSGKWPAEPDIVVSGSSRSSRNCALPLDKGAPIVVSGSSRSSRNHNSLYFFS